MSGACSTYGGEERFLQDLAVDGLMMMIITIIINGSSKKWGAWTGFIWRRIGDRWQAVVNAVMTIWVS